MGFVNEEKKPDKLPHTIPGWATLALLGAVCLTIIYLVYRTVTGNDPLHFLDRKAMILFGVADDKKKMVTA